MEIQEGVSHPNENNVTVMCWNILADCFTDVKTFPYAAKEILAYQYRINGIKEVFRKKNPDILCLQEVDLKSSMDKLLKECGYQYQYRSAGPQGIVTAFKSSKFKLLDTRIVNFSEARGKQFPSHVYDTAHGILMVRLQTVNKQNLLIANTHLYWNPHYQRVKYNQICCVVTAIKQYRQKGDRVVLCGDMNSSPLSNVCELVTSNCRPNKEKTTDCQKNFPQMCHKYKLVEGNLIRLNTAYNGSEGTYTNYTHKFKGWLDHIFYDSQALEVVRNEPLPRLEFIKNLVGIPNDIFYSDHLYLLTEFRLNSKYK